MSAIQMNLAPSSPASAPARIDARSFQRVDVNLRGRLMLATQEEYDCKVVQMSPGDMHVQCTGFPMVGERIIAYIDHLGRLEGAVSRITEHGFIVSLNATDRKREKLAAQLTWLVNSRELGLPEDRRHERNLPRNSRADLTLEDGQTYNCRIIDLSLSGAALELDIRPAIGTPARLGAMRGRVVRHFQEGVAIEFATLQTPDSLASLAGS
jgi:hypothetical protein